MITHIFFDLHHTLVDPDQLHKIHSRGLSEIMAQRYGKTPITWEEANHKIVADWDSYWADLNLLDDDGVEQLWEGWFRIYRALFRLTNTAEPPKTEITALVREILSTLHGNALYADVASVIRQLHEKGYHLGVMSHTVKGQIEAILRGGDVLDYFDAPLVGVDVTHRFDKDETFFRMGCQIAQAKPENCCLVDDTVLFLQRAKKIGMRTAHIDRKNSVSPKVDGVDFWLANRLDTLLEITLS